MSVDAKKEVICEVLLLATEYLGYLDECGNECAYTDSILDVISSKVISINDYRKGI